MDRVSAEPNMPLSAIFNYFVLFSNSLLPKLTAAFPPSYFQSTCTRVFHRTFIDIVLIVGIFIGWKHPKNLFLEISWKSNSLFSETTGLTPLLKVSFPPSLSILIFAMDSCKAKMKCSERIQRIPSIYVSIGARLLLRSLNETILAFFSCIRLLVSHQCEKVCNSVKFSTVLKLRFKNYGRVLIITILFVFKSFVKFSEWKKSSVWLVTLES